MHFPPISLDELTYDKNRRRLFGYSEMFGGSFPNEVSVKSHHTGDTKVFTPVKPDHTLFDEDGWDGEQQIYDTPGTDLVLVLTHAY